MAAKKVITDEINSNSKQTLENVEEEGADDDSGSIDFSDIVHHDLVGDLLIRLLNSPLIDDPYWTPTGNSKEMEAPAYLHFDITYDEIQQLCELASASFLQQSALIEIDKTELPLHVVADIHGNLPQVLRVFRTCGIPQHETFLFLGDYVDRGVQGVAVITLLFCLKIRYPYQVYLLRGNHEDANTTLNYGFFDECITRWPEDNCLLGVKIWRTYLEAFNCMPVAAIVAGTIFCAHGGISPFINKLDDINKIKRPSVVPAYGIGCDLVWSDPAPHRDGWTLSHRGISFLFGGEVVEEFCKKHKVDIILRGHQINNEMYKNGYRISFHGQLVTLFSAPNYMNYKNNSCVLTISRKFELKFTVFRCRYYQFGKKVEKHLLYDFIKKGPKNNKRLTHKSEMEEAEGGTRSPVCTDSDRSGSCSGEVGSHHLDDRQSAGTPKDTKEESKELGRVRAPTPSPERRVSERVNSRNRNASGGSTHSEAARIRGRTPSPRPPMRGDNQNAGLRRTIRQKSSVEYRASRFRNERRKQLQLPK